MSPIQVDNPNTPILEMPLEVQKWLLIVFGAATVGCLIFGFLQSRKWRSALPVLFVIAGFVTIVLEAPATNLGHVIHAQIGQIVLYNAMDRHIPWHLALIYAVFFGLVYQLLYARFRAGTLTEDYVWKVFAGTMVLNYLGEIVPVHAGAWVYYDPQALWIWRGTHPLFWTVLNAGCAILPATVILHFLDRLRGLKELWVLALSPIGAFMGHFGCGFPFYVASNAPLGDIILQVAGALSVVFCLLMVKLCIRDMLERQSALATDRRVHGSHFVVGAMKSSY